MFKKAKPYKQNSKYVTFFASHNFLRSGLFVLLAKGMPTDMPVMPNILKVSK